MSLFLGPSQGTRAEKERQLRVLARCFSKPPLIFAVEKVAGEVQHFQVLAHGHQCDDLSDKFRIKTIVTQINFHGAAKIVGEQLLNELAGITIIEIVIFDLNFCDASVSVQLLTEYAQ